MHGSRRRQQRRVQPHVEDSRGVSSPALKGATTHIEELWASVSVFPGRPRSKRRSKVTRGGRLPCHTLRPVGKIAASRWCGGARASKLTVHTSALEIKCLTDTVRCPAWKKGARRCALQTAPCGDASARDGHGPMTARGMGLLEVLRAPLSHRTASICSLHEHCSGRQLEGAT